MSDQPPTLTRIEPIDVRSSEKDTAWLVVDAVDLLWLIPRREALHLAPFQRGNAPVPGCGQLSWQNENYPVLAWDRGIRLTDTPDEQCQSALLLQGPDVRFALACHRLLRLDAPAFFTLPHCMRGRRQFFNQIAVLQGQAAGKVSAALLAENLPSELLQHTHIKRAEGGQG